MGNDLHFYIDAIGKIGMIVALFLGVPFCVWMMIKELSERETEPTSATEFNPDRGPNEAAADRRRAGPTDSATKARRLRDHRPHHPTKPKGRH